MSLQEQLSRTCDEFAAGQQPDAIWKNIPMIIAELRAEFIQRLGVRPEFSGVSLILASIDPTLACGTNSIVFDVHFPDHPGLRIRCECCLEHPNAKVAIRKTPEIEAEAAMEAVRLINAHAHPGTFEANLLRIG